MNNFTSEKFGTDNAACEQDNKTASGKIVTEDELLALQEKTLARQDAGEAVHDEGPEEEDIEEVEDYDGGIEDIEAFEKDNPSERDEAEQDLRHTEFEENPGIFFKQNFEEQLDYRYDKTEYYILDEALDWNAIESDPKQLFTVGNSKVAADTIIFNLQPARFCPSFEKGMCKIVHADDKTGEFKIACYAYQDERQYDIALQLRLRQMRFWDTHTADEIFQKLKAFYNDKKIMGGSMVYAIGKSPKTATATRAARKATHVGKPAPGAVGIKSAKLKFIRFNQSGDLKDRTDAIKMDEVARLAKKELNLDSYTYTARKDILNKYKFQYVHVQGSGFSAVTGINKAVEGGRGVKSLGKTFVAFPSLRDKKGNWMERDPKYKGLYYEDIFVKTTPDGKPNPNYDKYTKVNPSGWYACPGDCNSCPACKIDKFKNIAVKIHRSFHKIAKDWHDVEKVGAKGYRVHQKFDPYKRDQQGKPLEWSKEMETEYETRAAKLQKEKDFGKLSAPQQAKFVKDKLNNLYDVFNIDMNDDAFEDWQKEIKKWEKRAMERNISASKLRSNHGVPENKEINKLRKEDINKYATEDEKKFLKEWVGKNANNPEYKIMDWKNYAEKLKTKTVAELYYMRKDAHEAALAGDDLAKAGLPNNGGYYWDEVHMITDELRKRREALLKTPKVKKDSIEYDNFGDEIKNHPDYDPTRDQDIKKEDIDKYATEEEKIFLEDKARYLKFDPKKGGSYLKINKLHFKNKKRKNDNSRENR